MRAALDRGARSALERFIQRARRLLEEDLAHEAEGRFGIHVADGVAEGEDGLHLDPAGLGARRDVVEILEYLRREEPSGADAVARLIREATFTHLNRIVAIRIAEAIQLLPESLARGSASLGFKELLEVAPLLAHDASGGYWRYLRMCGDELASDLPQLFDPRNPLLELTPSSAALDDVVEMLRSEDLDDVWAAPDALGWVYQFFNSADEREAVHKRGAPGNAAELALVNQFFTPRYVVDFLVQNSLGRRLLQADPSSNLVDRLPMLLETPTDVGEPIQLTDVRVLDPACGSGHFLLGAYDVLESAWELQGVAQLEAAPDIVSSLWGIDIDPRCAQVAAAALVFRARQSGYRGDLPRPNIVTARSLPEPAVGWDEALGELPVDRRQLVLAMRNALADAPVLGPLLRVEELLSDEIRARVAGADGGEGTLFGSAGVADDEFGRAERDVLDLLQRIADGATSGAAERLLAAEAQDAIRFVEAMRQRYDVVLMNPPFGAPVQSTKGYLGSAYKWIPGTSDLFALFVGRGVELCRSSGLVGAITSRVALFLSSFEDWRREFLTSGRLVCLADLGEGVMEQAMVEAAAYVIGKDPRQLSSSFVRAVAADNKPEALSLAISQAETSPNVFKRDPRSFEALPSEPVVYWIDRPLVEKLARFSAFEPAHGVVRQGLATGDDFRFVRAWWEVSPRRSTRDPKSAGGKSTREQLQSGARWAPIVKAGASQPWYSPIVLAVDWEGDGERLRNFVDESGRLKSRPQNTDLYFLPGFSWTRRAPRLVPYVVPAGCIPSVSRYQAFPRDDAYAALGVVASNTATAFCRFYGEKFLWPNFLVDNVKVLPIPDIPDETRRRLAEQVRKGVADRSLSYRFLEPFREFIRPREGEDALDWDATSLLGDKLDSEVAEAYGLSAEERGVLELDLREALHTLGHGGPTRLDEEEDDTQAAEYPQRLLSYLVGVAVGRWDVRIGRDPSRAPAALDPFEPPAVCPPGMLVGPDGLPASEAPNEYPIKLPPNGLLVDEMGHPWDIEERVLAAGDALGFSVDDLMNEFGDLARRGLRGMLRRSFFKSHLAAYSKGRRKAPIYWPLTVPSGQWGIWAYAPTLSRETLYAIAAEALRREGHTEAEISRLERERETGGSGRGAKVLDKALDDERKLGEELRRFREEAERIASLGWEPDLDDGIVLCAAPLADLMPAWRDPALYRKDLRTGKYDWSTVSKWADQL
jgi:hypothetical protein